MMDCSERDRSFVVGQSASIQQTITGEVVQKFAEVSGDFNPIHIDDEYAKRSRFGEVIAHGMLSASFISALLGMKLPGPGAVYISQSLSFKRPVKVGDLITVEGVITEWCSEKRILTIETSCVNQYGKCVLDGTATLLVD